MKCYRKIPAAQMEDVCEVAHPQRRAPVHTRDCCAELYGLRPCPDYYCMPDWMYGGRRDENNLFKYTPLRDHNNQCRYPLPCKAHCFGPHIPSVKTPAPQMISPHPPLNATNRMMDTPNKQTNPPSQPMDTPCGQMSKPDQPMNVAQKMDSPCQPMDTQLGQTSPPVQLMVNSPAEAMNTRIQPRSPGSTSTRSQPLSRQYSMRKKAPSL